MCLAELEPPGSGRSLCSFEAALLLFLALLLSLLSPVLSFPSLSLILLVPVFSFICDEKSDLSIRTELDSTGPVGRHISVWPVFREQKEAKLRAYHVPRHCTWAIAFNPHETAWHSTSQMGKLKFPGGLLAWLEIVQPVIQQVGQAWV